jgi:hypothetical protein
MMTMMMTMTTIQRKIKGSLIKKIVRRKNKVTPLVKEILPCRNQNPRMNFAFLNVRLLLNK